MTCTLPFLRRPAPYDLAPAGPQPRLLPACVLPPTGDRSDPKNTRAVVHIEAPTETDTITAGGLRAILVEWQSRGHTTVVVDRTATVSCDDHLRGADAPSAKRPALAVLRQAQVLGQPRPGDAA
jgi:hypothetical protein